MPPSEPESELPSIEPEIVTPGVAISGTVIWIGLVALIAVVIWRIVD